MLATINTNLQLPKGAYREAVFEKRHIVLHYTAGYNAAGALATWKKTPSRDGTAFIVDRDGQVYQVFDPRFWAVHIYRHQADENPAFYTLEKQSIGIEIVNLGPLTLGTGDKNKSVLYTYTGKKYCTLADTALYVQDTWKGKHYWQAYTNAQYEAVRTLCKELERDFQIPMNAAPLGDRLNVWDVKALTGYRGVTTHCNYRKDKFDVGPAFQWAKAGLHE
ncbi:MAG: N-acetylmuramoyl-L-alanine amidase [Bacteroidetes bacterium]|nr:N-acetylmuramoyl-L-alanine amidase [Bacteroidota bacterium]